MPWVSRIADEQRRRWVLAGVMFALLVILTAIAALANHWQQTAWRSYAFEPYRFELPPSMRFQRPRQLAHPEMGAMRVLSFRTADPRRMTLQVSVLALQQPREVNDVWSVAYRWLAPGESFSDDRVRITSGPLEAMYRVAWDHGRREGAGPSRHGVLAVATTDQRAYLLFYLTAAGPPTEQTPMMMERILRTVQRGD